MLQYSSDQQAALEALAETRDEAALWRTIIAFQSYPFFTASGLPFTYTLKRGRNGDYNRELLIDRRENSKTLTWGSIRLVFSHALEKKGQIVEKPKALGDIWGVSYIYPLLWKFGVIEVPQKFAETMDGVAQ